MFALSRVGAPGCFIVGLFAFYLLLGDWGLLNGGFLLMNLAVLRRVSVCFISFFVLIVFVSLLKSILGKPKILCLDSSCAGQSFMRWSAVSSFFWRCEQSLQYIVDTGFFLCQTTFQRNVAHAREMWPEMWPIMPRAMYFVEIPITMRRFSQKGKYCTCQTLTVALKHM